MIGAQQVVERALAEAARLGKADETIVLVSDRTDASLRWAGNSMTTNGESVSRTTTVISIVRQGVTARVGSVETSDVDPSAIPGLVAASQDTALAAPEARDAAPPLPGDDGPDDWDAPVPGTSVQAFLDVAGSLAARGSAGRISCTGSRGTVSRRRSWPRRTACAGASRSRPGRWRSTPNVTVPARGRASALPTSLMCQRIRCSSGCRRGWAGRGAPSSCLPVGTRRSCRRRRWPT